MGRFLILGKEERQKYLFQMLCAKGQTVTYCDSWLDGDYDAVLLPVTQTAAYVEQIADQLQAGEYVFGCNFPTKLTAYKRKQGIFFIDYMKEEGAVYLNAAATAEGAIAEAIISSKEVLFGEETLVIGYGRCGQALTQRLQAFGAKVTVYEKEKEKIAMAKACGLNAVAADAVLPAEFWMPYRYLFNTAPKLVLDSSKLMHMRRDVQIFDLASKPGGVDFGYCEKNGLHAKLCSGMPAKYAPKAAAKILMTVLESYMKEVMSYDAG